MEQLLQNWLDRGVEEKVFPGAVAACGTAERVLDIAWAGIADPDGTPVNRETRYDMASLTKILSTTMIAFKALESGKITLYDHLDLFFDNVPEDKQPITVLHLMTHTAGIIPSFHLEDYIDTPDKRIDCILNHPLVHPVGEQPDYTCMGYITLAAILEKVYAKPLDVLAQEMVFTPLRMHHTGYCPTGGNIAATELNPKTGKCWKGIVHDENARFQNGVSGNAGVFSCIDDMILFAQMLAKNDGSFLSPATMRKALNNYTPGFDVHRGLGFHLAGTPENFMGDLFPECSFGHTGFTGTSMAIDPESGFFVILLSNRVCPTRDNPRLMRYRRLFHNALYAAFSRC